MEHEPLQPITASQVATITAVATRYTEDRDQAEEWLEARGIAPETAATFLLGCVTDPAPEHRKVEGWLSIPYLGTDSAGNTGAWAIRFRCLDQALHPGLSCKQAGHSKYWGLPGASSRVFNVRAIQDADDEIHVCEGELDAVVLSQAGFPAIALAGASQWRPHHRHLLAGFSHVYVWADPDDAGTSMANTILSACRNAALVRLATGDVTDTFLHGGYEALDEAREKVLWT
jgi:DNA primase